MGLTERGLQWRESIKSLVSCIYAEWYSAVGVIPSLSLHCVDLFLL